MMGMANAIKGIAYGSCSSTFVKDYVENAFTSIV
jgi:hypothetical protein